MRRIISKEEEKKKRKRKQLIVGLVLIIVMLGSTFGIVVNSFGKKKNSDEKIIYNNVEFERQGNYWSTRLGEKIFIFRYNPKEVLFIPGYVKSFSDYAGKPLYIYSESEGAELEIYRNFQNIVQRMQKACYKECEEDLPIKNCDNNFIIIQNSSIVNIVQNKSCVYITGPEENLTQITDEFLFKAIGIEK